MYKYFVVYSVYYGEEDYEEVMNDVVEISYKIINKSAVNMLEDKIEAEYEAEYGPLDCITLLNFILLEEE